MSRRAQRSLSNEAQGPSNPGRGQRPEHGRRGLRQQFIWWWQQDHGDREDPGRREHAALPHDRHVQPVLADRDGLPDERGRPLQRAAVHLQHAQLGPGADPHAGDRKQLLQRRQDADPDHPQGCEVERRQAVQRRGRGLHVQHAQEQPEAEHQRGTRGDQRQRTQRDHGRAELQELAVREPVPDRAGLHRAAAHLVNGQRPGHVRRRQAGRHRPVHARQVLAAGLHAEAEPVLLGQVQGARAGDRLPGLQHQRQPGPAGVPGPDRLRGQLHRQHQGRTSWPRARRTTPG